MKRFELRRSVEGGLVVVFGIIVLALIPTQIRSVVVGQTEMSPSFIPAVVAVGLILAGLGLIAKAYFVDTAHPRIDATREGVLRVVAAVLLLIGYTMVFPRLGFVVASGLALGVFILLFGARAWLKISLSVVLVPIVVWLFFEKLFRIPLPHGLLF